MWKRVLSVEDRAIKERRKGVHLDVEESLSEGDRAIEERRDGMHKDAEESISEEDRAIEERRDGMQRDAEESLSAEDMTIKERRKGVRIDAEESLSGKDMAIEESRTECLVEDTKHEDDMPRGCDDFDTIRNIEQSSTGLKITSIYKNDYVIELSRGEWKSMKPKRNKLKFEKTLDPCVCFKNQ